MSEIEKGRHWRAFYWTVGIAVVISVALMLANISLTSRRLLDHELAERARAHYQAIVLARDWNARHGGVFVRKEQGVQSNPYLENPDIETTAGVVYTKRNPALMTREISEIAAEKGLVRYHITSLKPINPANKADKFETAALESFVRGVPEVSEKFLENGQTAFRYMAPLVVKKPCLQCHAAQGYKVGDIRGGISVQFNVAEMATGISRKATEMGAIFLAIMIVLLVVGHRQVAKLYRRLQSSSERWQFALEGTGDGVWDWDTQSDEVFFSGQWKAMLGFAEGEIGNTFAEWKKRVHSADRTRCIEELERHLRGETEFYADEHRVLCKDGSYKWVLDRGKVVERTPDGRPLRVIGILADLSERKNNENALRESEAYLHSIIDNAPVGIFLKDRGGRLLAANRAHLDRHKVTIDQVVGKTTYDYNAKAIADQVSRQEQLVMESGEPRAFEITRQQDDGSERILMVARFPLVAKDGELIGVGGINVDVTERTQMERQLIQAQKMQVIGQLTGGVAHDFNNLLQVIETNLELVRMMVAKDSKVSEYLDNAVRAGRRGATLTQQLLAFSRKQSLRPQRIDPNELMLGLRTMLSRTLGEDIEVTTSVVDAPHAITADENGLTNALLNLAVNARAAMPRGGHLTISSAPRRLDVDMPVEAEVLPAGDYVEIAVADTGCGMSDETRRKAFEPFFTTKKVGEGSGLGLSMVYGFARQSGGTVRIDSELGKGTTVRMLLPAAAEIAEMPDVADEPRPSLEHAPRVLLVEDDDDVRLSSVALLKSLGCEVVEAENGDPVLATLRQRPDINVMVCDVVLPGDKNGIELAQDAARLRPDLCVILVSGYPEGTLQQIGLPDAGFPLLRKPFSRDDLAKALETAVTASGVS